MPNNYLDLLAVIVCILVILITFVLFISSFNFQNIKRSFRFISHSTKKFLDIVLHNSRFQFTVLLIIVVFILGMYITALFPNFPQTTSPTTTTTTTSPLGGNSTTSSIVSSVSNPTTSLPEQPSTPACVAPCSTISIPSNLFNLISAYIVFIFIGLFLLSIAVLRLRSHRSNTTISSSESATSKKVENRDKNRESIITSYLRASAYLEQLGADKRFSLTPQEFEDNVKVHLREIWTKFPRITYFYELARFSEQPMSESALREFNDLIAEFYNELNQYIQKITPSSGESKK